MKVDRAGQLRELFPLTIHYEAPQDFVRVWNGARAYAAGMHHSCAVPGRPDWMDFSGALLALKAGHDVTRDAWNNRGRFVFLQVGYPQGVELNGNTQAALGSPPGARGVFSPYPMVCTGTKRVVAGLTASVLPVFGPWTADADDLMAEDWKILPTDAAAEPVDVTEFGANRPVRL